MWKVYKLVNVSLNECFVGATDGDPQACLRRAADQELEAIDHWDGEEHKITLEILKELPGELEAIEFLGEAAKKDGCKTEV